MMDGPWIPYEPEWEHSSSVMFLHLDTIDWYVYRESICAKYLLLLDSEGLVIKAESEDKAQIFPADLYTATTQSIPEDFEPCKYCFSNGEFVKYVPKEQQVIERNEAIRRKRLKQISEDLDILNTLAISEALTDEDAKRLQALKQYVRSLMAVDLLSPQWPEINIGS